MNKLRQWIDPDKHLWRFITAVLVFGVLALAGGYGFVHLVGGPYRYIEVHDKPIFKPEESVTPVPSPTHPRFRFTMPPPPYWATHVAVPPPAPSHSPEPAASHTKKPPHPHPSHPPKPSHTPGPPPPTVTPTPAPTTPVPTTEPTVSPT